jgi:hypothetical protein
MQENMQDMTENMLKYARKYVGKYAEYKQYAEYVDII